MCPKRPCYKCKLDRCLLFNNPELEPETRATNYDIKMPSVRDTGQPAQGTYKG